MGLNQETASIDFVGVCDTNLHSVFLASGLKASQSPFQAAKSTPAIHLVCRMDAQRTVFTVIILIFKVLFLNDFKPTVNKITGIHGPCTQNVQVRTFSELCFMSFAWGIL
jgi:hypothetical protein